MEELMQTFGKIFSRKDDSQTQQPKVRYFNCDVDPQHADESLNYVCLDKTCRNKGLLCSICRNSGHQKHSVLPLKVLFQQLNADTSTQQDNKPLEKALAQLQKSHSKTMNRLTQTVERLAQKVQQIESTIMEEYMSQRKKIIRQFEIKNNFKVTKQLVQSQGESLDRVRKQINNLIDSLQYNKQKSKYVVSSDKYRIQISSQKTVKAFDQKQKKIQTMLSELQSLFNTKTNFFRDIVDTPIIFSQIPATIPLSYRFSDMLKAKSIILTQNYSQAKQTQSNNGQFRYALIQPSLPLNSKSKIIIKVKNLAHWVGVGICFKSIIVAKSYKFLYDNLGHGSYLLSSNGYIWSTTEASDNIAKKGFQFKNGASILVEFDPEHKKLIYQLQGDSQKFEQNIQIAPHSEGNIYFCANLCNKNDEVRIVS